jgi:hypothetical protein
VITMKLEQTWDVIHEEWDFTVKRYYSTKWNIFLSLLTKLFALVNKVG